VASEALPIHKDNKALAGLPVTQGSLHSGYQIITHKLSNKKHQHLIPMNMDSERMRE
jgi:hypothetical protein